MAKRKRQPHKPRRPAASASSSGESTVKSRSGWIVGLGIATATIVMVGGFLYWQLLSQPSGRRMASDGRRVPEGTSPATQDALVDDRTSSRDPAEVLSSSSPSATPPTRFFKRGQLTLVWDTIKPDVRQRVQPVSAGSNIAPADYVGPEACQACHEEQYQDWSTHPHRWMNALANSGTVLGDFSGESTLQYQGGVGRFYRDGERYLMSYERGELRRVYEISQTIGSRFHQYYIGKGLVGPEPQDHPYYSQDHVLPFGYWLERKSWGPVVHVHDELPESQRWEQVQDLKPRPGGRPADVGGVSRSRGVFDEGDPLPLVYARACNFCHTTFPIGDMFVRMPDTLGASLTEPLLFGLSDYVAKSHSGFWDGSQPPQTFPSEKLQELTGKFIQMEAPHHAASLGVSCEACHLGGREHAEIATRKPAFTPQSPDLYAFKDPATLDTGRTAQNINSACARCHSGARPTYANGIATWNSTEHSDAMKGSCYSQLSCIECHDPHKATGKVWQRTAVQDDDSCLKCHEALREPVARQKHTHHAAGSTGDQCMNCHMPHINEGLDAVVRTHTIFSPTSAPMIEANQPNACNLCHLEQPIDWTLQHLSNWYGKTFSEAAIEANYPHRNSAVGSGWLQSPHEATRLVASAAFARQKAEWGLSELIEQLDDPYLLNRLFAQKSIEQLLNTQLNQEYQYWYYMTPPERREPIDRLRQKYRR